MIFRQFIDDDLGCASYLVADAGEAALVDPSWDIAPYLAFARAHSLRITRVFETHTHADHVSGRGRIVAATGAEVFLPATALGAFPHRSFAGGDVVTFGAVRIAAIATPGHRPEHLALTVTDLARGEDAVLVLSGDSLLVGDVARPDLATASAAEVDVAARQLFRSVHRLGLLPDHAELWPGHIGGSLCCGAGTSEKPSSTIGLERRVNPGLVSTDADGFVDGILDRLPGRPPTVEGVVALNRGPLLGEPAPVRVLEASAVEALVAAGATLVDGRPSNDFDDAHIPGSISVAIDHPGAGTRAAWLVDPVRAIVLVGGNEGATAELANRLAAVGLHEIAGRLDGGVDAWVSSGRAVGQVERVSVAEAAARLVADAAVLVDVRDREEHETFVIPGSLLIPWRELAARIDEVRATSRPIIVACAGGGRAGVAASLLSRPQGPPVSRIAEGGIAQLARTLSERRREHGAARAASGLLR